MGFMGKNQSSLAPVFARGRITHEADDKTIGYQNIGYIYFH